MLKSIDLFLCSLNNFNGFGIITCPRSCSNGYILYNMGNGFRHTFHTGDKLVDYLFAHNSSCNFLNSPSNNTNHFFHGTAKGIQHITQAACLQSVCIDKANRTIKSEQIRIEGTGYKQVGRIKILLTKPIHSRLILPCPQVQHARRRIVGLGIIGKAAHLLRAHLLAESDIREGLHFYGNIWQGRGYLFSRNKASSFFELNDIFIH